MPRKPEVDRPVPLYLMLPTSKRGRLDLFLFSELEGRVPKGAYQRFFLERMDEFFSRRQVDLAAFLNVQPGTATISATPEVIEMLLEKLKR